METERIEAERPTPSVVGVGGAMRARDVSAPTDADEAEAVAADRERAKRGPYVRPERSSRNPGDDKRRQS